MKNAAYAVALMLSATVSSQAASWTQVTTTNSPVARSSPAMAYDSVRGVVVMFGGLVVGGIGAVNETWEYDGVSWTQVTTAANPCARYDHAMAYDAVRGKVVVFGGVGCGGLLNDTWEYDGASWTQTPTINAPSARTDHAMVYDSSRGKITMFGGGGGGGTSLVGLGDTWEYDGITWAQVTTTNSPSPRYWHAMAFDSFRGSVVLFGGHAGVGGAGVIDDTWEYDGVNWSQLSTASSPGIRTQHSIAFDSARSQLVMFGGIGGSYLSDTAEYDGLNWSPAVTTANPVGRFGHAMAFDSARGKVVMFGGYGGGFPTFLNDTWEYVGSTVAPQQSVATPYGAGCGTPSLGLYPTANPIIGSTVGALIANAPTSFGGVTIGWSDTHLTGLPLLPLDLSSIGMPGCSLLHSNDVYGLPATPLTVTTMQFDFAIPFNASLLGSHVYLQAYCLAPGQNPLDIIASNGIDWLIGNQ